MTWLGAAAFAARLVRVAVVAIARELGEHLSAQTRPVTLALPPAEPPAAEHQPAPVRPARPVPSCAADPELAAHYYPDGGMGHTGDLWASILTVEAMACGDYHSGVEAYCHREPRHRAVEIAPDCQGIGADGRLYTW